MKCLLLFEKPYSMKLFKTLYEKNKEVFEFIPEFYYSKYKVIAEKNKDKYNNVNFEDLEKTNGEFYFYKFYYFDENNFFNLLKDCDYIINVCDSDDEGDISFDLTIKEFNINIPTKRLYFNNLKEETLLNAIKELF